MLSFQINIRTRKLRNLVWTYCLNLLFKLTVWIYRLILLTKAPKNITLLNTKLGSSVILFIANFILSLSKFF